jgi:glycerol kinase
MSYVVALDQGTTSSRAIVFDSMGRVRSVAQREFRQIYPRAGWVEHDPDEIVSSQVAVLKEAIEKAAAPPSAIAAIGVTNQRETTIVWDRSTGRPVHNAVVWQDRRTAPICERLKAAGAEEVVRRKSGLVIDAYFSGPKVAWILDNVDGARSKADAGELAFGTVDAWLIWNLTGGRRHATDASNASRTMLYDIRLGEWDDDLLKLLDVPRSVLPEVRSSSEVYGRTSKDLLGVEVPIAGVAGDQQAALFGQMCVEPGLAKNTYGTGCFLLLNTGEVAVESRNRLLTTVAWKIGDRTEYALEGSVFVGGAVVQWLRDGLGILKNSRDVQTLAAGVEDNGGVYMVPAFVGLGAPHWDPYARGAILGLTRGTTAAHLARAAQESIALQVADLLEAMQADAGVDLAELRVDGGAAVDDLLLQIQSDVLGIPVVRPTATETTALGAAYLAGLAVGFWDDLKTLRRQWRVDRRFEPHAPKEAVQRLRSRWRQAVERAKGWELEGGAET